MTDSSALAIVGAACIFPGAPTLEAFWNNICAGVDATSAPPPGRLDPVFRGSDGRRMDRFACWHGGFIDDFARFDPIEHGLMPAAVRSAEPEQLLSLQVAAAALADAGYRSGLRAPRRTSVILGRGNYTSAARSRLELAIRGAEQFVQSLAELFPNLTKAELERVRELFQRNAAPPEREEVVNLVPNLAAARIAERFDFEGAAYTLDAACASSLVAVDQACASLRAGSVDLALAGGVHLCHSEDFWGVFHQVGLLSTNGVGRPLDQRADGLLIGEGVGFVVLKREQDAVRAGDRIYARIAGTGVASDGRGTSVMRPNSQGQTRALECAWRNSGEDPRALELLEAHATGTQVGDGVEIDTVSRFFAGRVGQPITMGSVKSMIGHAMPAAGVAGLIKTMLGVYHGVLPPSLHCERPRPDLLDGGFVVRPAAQAWTTERRTAAVNAFGFGGINAHVVLTSASASRAMARSSRARDENPLERVAFYAAPTREALIEAVRGDQRGHDGAVRAAIVAVTAEKREWAADALRAGRPVYGRKDIFCSDQLLLGKGGHAVCLFPGFDGEAPPGVQELSAWLGDAPAQLDPSSLEARGRAILSSNRTVYRALARMGLAFHAFAGHSVGEWSAMEAAGVCSERELQKLADALAPGSIGDPHAAFVAAGTSAAHAMEVVADLERVAISHDNCPHQTVIACTTELAPQVLQRFSRVGVVAQVMPFGTGVHSPFFEPYLQRSMATLAGLTLRPSSFPLYSATTASPYPAAPSDIRTIIGRHMVEPVQFRALVERMYEDGARVFVQAGAGPLAGFVADTLRGRPHLAISAHNRSGGDALQQLLRVACAVWVEGGQLGLVNEHSTSRPRVGEAVSLSLGVPLIRLGTSLETSDRAPRPPRLSSHAGSLEAVMNANWERVIQAQRQVAATLESRPRAVKSTPRPASTQAFERRFSLEEHPELIDHSFYRQPADWSDVRDRSPVMPMTGLLEILTQAAHSVTPRVPVTGLRDVWAKRWLNVSDPVLTTVRVTDATESSLKVEIGDFAQGRLDLGGRSAAQLPFQSFPLKNRTPCPVSVEQLYAEGWMFHGPLYRSVASIDALGEDGIEGSLVRTGGIGSLLDGAGQLLGLWLMLTATRDRFAMPIRIRRLRYLREQPELGQVLRCSIRVTEVSELRLVADLRIGCDAWTWIEIEGWEDRRFPTDDRLWHMIREPDRSTLCDLDGDSVVIPRKRYETISTFDMLLGRYFRHDERQRFTAPQGRSRWPELLSAIAAKDAVRTHLREKHGRASFPAEFTASSQDGRRFLVAQRNGAEFSVFVHVDELNVRARLLTSTNALE